MDIRLQQIVSKAAGTYFIVTDASEVTAIEAENKLRLFFINTEKGGVNSLHTFSKGNKSGFTAIFGNGKRSTEIKGNFSISECLKALEAGPIAVVNLRKFTDVDTAGIFGLNPNIEPEDEKTTKYSNLFNTNSFWSPKASNMINILEQPTLLNIGNIGIDDLSIFVTKADYTDVDLLTEEGENTLASTALNIEEYPALDGEMLVKDTFVNVYVFKNKFNVPNINTNQYFGQYFDNNGNIDLANIDALSNVVESGFVKKFTGSLIPNLVSEKNVGISIDSVINSTFTVNGIICSINDELFEADNTKLLDMFGSEFHDNAGTKIADTSDYMLSHIAPVNLTTAAVVYPLTEASENVAPVAANVITYGCEFVDTKNFIGSFEQGLRVDDYIKGANGNPVKITAITIIDAAAVIGATTDTYTKVKYTCSGSIGYTITGVAPNQVYSVKKLNYFVNKGLIHPFDIISYKPRAAQFTDGTSAKQSEILDLMNEPYIVKGLKSVKGLRYIVDCFKSFVEPNYKYQFGILENTLDEGNKFVRAIINEPFMEDIQKSTNPLFAQEPGGTFDINYLPDGGNKNYSTKLLTKFTTGESLCFAFGPGNKVGTVTRPVAGMVSNVFYAKKFPFDVAANSTGYVDGIVEIEYPFDDTERAALEKFRYNPIIDIDGVYTIYGNLSMQKKVTKQQQIHNSELLCYIKENLFSKAKGDAFKKGTYDEYLQTETEMQDFMKNLSLALAIQPDFTVKCNAENNTKEISDYKIKLVEVSYTPYNAIEKVVFSLTIN